MATRFDMKNEDGQYAQVIRVLGGNPIRSSLAGSGSQLDPLDPRIFGVNDDELNTIPVDGQEVK
jgi:hypothetical protein